MNVASGNIGKNHFRRATEFPQDWTDYNDSAYLYGYAQPGDLVGPWLYVDMQKALSLLHWKYRYFDPYWYYAKYSGGCTFRHKDGGAQGSYTTLDAIKAQAIADWNSQPWSTGESTYASKVNAIAQSWVVQVDPPTSHCDASLEMEKVTYRFAVGSAAQSIMSMFLSAWRHGSGTTDESGFDSFGLGYIEGAANLIQTFDFSQSVSTDQAETKLLGDCPDPPGWPTHLYRADEGQNFLQGERGYILDNYAHCILDYVAGGKYVYY